MKFYRCDFCNQEIAEKVNMIRVSNIRLGACGIKIELCEKCFMERFEKYVKEEEQRTAELRERAEIRRRQKEQNSGVNGND